MKTPRPFIPYFGAKWRAAKHYPPPQHNVIVEPFAGGAGYALNYCDRRVLLVDKYPVIVNLWKYLINVKESEFRALPLVTHVDDAHGVPQEAKHLIGWWLNHATTTPRKSASSRARQRPKAHWGPEVRDALAAQLHMIRHWCVVDGSYAQIPITSDVTYYVDPPYQDQGRNYIHNSIDFGALASWCRAQHAARSQLIVCEQQGADWLPFRHLRNFQNAGNRKDGRTYSAEMIWP